MKSTIKPYPLSKSRHVMQWAYSWYKAHIDTLTEGRRKRIEEKLAACDAALLSSQSDQASELAHELEVEIGPWRHKAYWRYLLEVIGALIVALFIATVVRQTLFENQEIPSGSMRPTYKEQDRLIVSKVAYGLNVPFATSHFYFNPSLLQRTAVFTFSADNLPMQDSESSYFGIFPYKKRLIKRLMGKPGDTLYFYGGKVYGMDSEGKPIEEFLTAPWLKGLEYIPFMNFAGEVEQEKSNSFILKQLNEPIGQITALSSNELIGKIFNGKEWIVDDPLAATKPHDVLKTYSDFWGIRNFAMAQLITAEEATERKDFDVKTVGTARLYLELRHTPSLTQPSPQLFRQSQGFFLSLSPYRTYLPLEPRHLNALMDTLYTARFVVEDGNVRRYSSEGDLKTVVAMRLEGVANGTYEFYHGKAFSIGWGGIASPVSPDSPLYKRSLSNIQQLFNLGIDLHPAFAVRERQMLFPHRYAYFRDGELYVMGAPIFKRDDPVLVTFQIHELRRQRSATAEHPYVAFRDHGPPLTPNGTIDRSFVAQFGLHVPEGHYLALGDNHAMSGDSRIWGFVPEANIQGAPSFVYWPPSERWGAAKRQPPTPWVTIPHLVAWSLLLLLAAASYLWHRHVIHKPIFKQLSSPEKK